MVASGDENGPNNSGRATSTRGAISGDDRLTQGACGSLWVMFGDTGWPNATQCGSGRRTMAWLVVVSWVALAGELLRFP